ncbi:MAG: efflux RND transporter periplasmic adaptor subunit, partial [Actinobacteria bacterium]|nr:efflux RND transporter periplasmic adaptor subunit [Actinomycetota bacterium]
KVVPRDYLRISFKSIGEISFIAEEGDVFKKGEVIAKLDEKDFKNQLDLAKTALGLAEKELEMAELTLKSTKDAYKNTVEIANANYLLAQKTVEQAEIALRDAHVYYDKLKNEPMVTASIKKQANMAIHQAEAGLEQAKVALSQTYWNCESMRQAAKSQVDSAEKAIELSEDKIISSTASLKLAQDAYDNATLKAPFDGEVIEVYQKVGEMASPGMPVIYFGTSDVLKIVADVDEDDISMIRKGQEVEISFHSYPGVTIKGKVINISLGGTEFQGVVTYDVDIEFEASQDINILPAMTCDIEIVAEKIKDTIFLPSDYIFEEEDKYYVNLLAEKNKKVKTEITIGYENEDYTQILSGLKQDDKISKE